MYEMPCHACGGLRYRPETLAVRINGVNIAELSDMSIVQAKQFLNNLTLTSKPVSYTHLDVYKRQALA